MENAVLSNKTKLRKRGDHLIEVVQGFLGLLMMRCWHCGRDSGGVRKWQQSGGEMVQIPTIRYDIGIGLHLAKLPIHVGKVADCQVANQPVAFVKMEARVGRLHL